MGVVLAGGTGGTGECCSAQLAGAHGCGAGCVGEDFISGR